MAVTRRRLPLRGGWHRQATGGATPAFYLYPKKFFCDICAALGILRIPVRADLLGADWYAKDAKQSADIAKEFFGA